MMRVGHQNPWHRRGELICHHQIGYITTRSKQPGGYALADFLAESQTDASPRVATCTASPCLAPGGRPWTTIGSGWPDRIESLLRENPRASLDDQTLLMQPAQKASSNREGRPSALAPSYGTRMPYLAFSFTSS
jgi:hypothetical protein